MFAFIVKLAFVGHSSKLTLISYFYFFWISTFIFVVINYHLLIFNINSYFSNLYIFINFLFYEVCIGLAFWNFSNWHQITNDLWKICLLLLIYIIHIFIILLLTIILDPSKRLFLFHLISVLVDKNIILVNKNTNARFHQPRLTLILV